MRYSVGKPKEDIFRIECSTLSAEDVQVKRTSILVGLIAMMAFVLSS
jgi:hypothetical protein